MITPHTISECRCTLARTESWHCLSVIVCQPTAHWFLGVKPETTRWSPNAGRGDPARNFLLTACASSGHGCPTFTPTILRGRTCSVHVLDAGDCREKHFITTCVVCKPYGVCDTCMPKVLDQVLNDALCGLRSHLSPKDVRLVWGCSIVMQSVQLQPGIPP